MIKEPFKRWKNSCNVLNIMAMLFSLILKIFLMVQGNYFECFPLFFWHKRSKNRHLHVLPPRHSLYNTVSLALHTFRVISKIIWFLLYDKVCKVSIYLDWQILLRMALYSTCILCVMKCLLSRFSSFMVLMSKITCCAACKWCLFLMSLSSVVWSFRV